MIVKPFTFITFLMFAASGAYLFAVKYELQVLGDQVSQASAATKQDEQEIRVLQAQWALEAGPSRLAELAAQFTKLQPMKPTQMVTMASLSSALPPPGSAVPGQNPEDEMPVMPVVAQAAAAPADAVQAAAAPAGAAQVAAASQAAAVPAAPVQLAAASPAVAAPVHLAAARPLPRRQMQTPPEPERLASVEAMVRSLPGAHRARERHEAASHIYVASTAAQPMGAQVMSVRAVASVAPAAPPEVEDGGSMLGMASGGGN